MALANRWRSLVVATASLGWLVGGCAKQEAARPTSAMREAADRKASSHDTDETEARGAFESLANQEQAPGRRFVRTAKARFRVKDVYGSVLAIEDLVTAHGGFVERNAISSDVREGESHAIGEGKRIELAPYGVSADLRVRLPSEQTQEFLRALAGQVDFLDSREFGAVDARLELLRRQLAQLRHQDEQKGLQKGAHGEGTTDAVVARASAQGERDAAAIEQKVLEDRIAFSTIELQLYQSAQLRRSEELDLEAAMRAERPSFFSQLGPSLSRGWDGLLTALVVFVTLWPLWLVVALIGGLIAWRRRVKARRKASERLGEPAPRPVRTGDGSSAP